MSIIRVLLVDDHEIVRLGLMTLINDQENMEVVGEHWTFNGWHTGSLFLHTAVQHRCAAHPCWGLGHLPLRS